MPNPYDLVVQISGGEHSGKTSLLALFGDFLKQHGVEYTMQRVDEKLDEKLENIETSIERVRRSRILLTEFQTFPTIEK